MDAILARTGSATLQAIAASSQGDSKQVMEELAHRHLIEPLVTQGHIGDVLKDKIVYDAQTTSGGSGGPLFNDQGQVIGINFAILRDFGARILLSLCDTPLTFENADARFVACCAVLFLTASGV